MNFDKRKLTIQLLTLIGFALTIKLAMIYYAANYDKYALASFCSVNEFIDCDGAARTTVSQFWGIPLAYWGMLFYITVFFLTFVDKLKNIKILKFLEVFKNPMSYITFLGTIAFGISMILAGFSMFVIKKLCILCVITYFIDFAIALISANNFKEYFTSFKTTFSDFIDGAKKYPKTLVIILIFATAFFCYSGITDNFVPHVKKSKDLKKYSNMLENPYRAEGNLLGSENADVVIELYSDYVCPLCYIHNIMLHRIVKEYSNVKIIHHNLPFDKECNFDIGVNAHPGACYMARAALAAEKQGNYWGMASLLYENAPMNDEQLLPIIKKLNFNEQQFFKDMNSKEIEKKLADEIYQANNVLAIEGTPTMYVNGDKKLGVMSYDDLKKYLEEHGAKRR